MGAGGRRYGERASGDARQSASPSPLTTSLGATSATHAASARAPAAPPRDGARPVGEPQADADNDRQPRHDAILGPPSVLG